jgi:rhodanese-related sulfurtransferase
MTVGARRHPRAERALLVAAVVAAGLAAIAGSPRRPVPGVVDVARLAEIVEQEEDHVTAVELAKWIRDGVALRVLDIRSEQEFDELHIPGAARVPLAEIARMTLDSSATYVLYSEGGTHAAQGWFLLRARGLENVYFLRGGLYEWLEQVMSPRVPASMPQVERDSIRALTMWFGGKMEVVDSAAAGSTATRSALDGPLAVPRERDTRDEIRKVRRRAC